MTDTLSFIDKDSSIRAGCRERKEKNALNRSILPFLSLFLYLGQTFSVYRYVLRRFHFSSTAGLVFDKFQTVLGIRGTRTRSSRISHFDADSTKGSTSTVHGLPCGGRIVYNDARIAISHPGVFETETFYRIVVGSGRWPQRSAFTARACEKSCNLGREEESQRK